VESGYDAAGPDMTAEPDVSDFDELRALVREVIRDLLPKGLPVAETVNLSTDDDLAAFVERLLDLDAEQREELRSGRKRFRLAALPVPPSSTLGALGRPGPSSPSAPSGQPAQPAVTGPVQSPVRSPMRRIESGAVKERVIKAAAQVGERRVLGRAAVLTPLARDRARASGVEIEKER
jgi:hypothetical protein